MAVPALRLNERLANLNYDNLAEYGLHHAAHNMNSHINMIQAIPITGKEIVLDFGSGISISGKLIAEKLKAGMQQVYMLDKSSRQLEEARKLTDPNDNLDDSHFVRCDFTNYAAMLQAGKRLPKFDVIIGSHVFNHLVPKSQVSMLTILANDFLKVGGVIVLDLPLAAPSAFATDPETTDECAGWVRSTGRVVLRPCDVTMSFRNEIHQLEMLIDQREREALKKQAEDLAVRVGLTLVTSRDLDYTLFKEGENKSYREWEKAAIATKHNHQGSLGGGNTQAKIQDSLISIDRERRKAMPAIQARCDQETRKEEAGRKRHVTHTGPFSSIVVLQKPEGYSPPM